MVPAKKGSREDQKKYKSYLKPYGLSDKRMAELDALEVYYPGGIAGFVEEAKKTFASTTTALPADRFSSITTLSSTAEGSS
jgi:hypothetical protein